MTIQLGILLALICAFVSNLGFFFKHRGACECAKVDIRRPFRTARNLYGSKWFAIGMAIATSAWIFHVAALAVAPISVVQVVLAGGVVMIGVMADRLFGVSVGNRQWWGLALTCLGLVLLAVTFPTNHDGAHSSFSTPAMIAFEAGLFGIGGLLIMGPRVGAPAEHHGVMLGAAAGVLFGVSDVAIKALTGIAGHEGLLGLAASPWLYVTIAASVAAFFSSARGLQDGDAVPVIAITGTAANVTTVAAGIIVFGDPLPGSTLGIVLQALAFLLVIVASAMTPAPRAAASGSAVGMGAAA
jgi:multidrug transporter EmrE-like cation transporter